MQASVRYHQWHAGLCEGAAVRAVKGSNTGLGFAMLDKLLWRAYVALCRWVLSASKSSSSPGLSGGKALATLFCCRSARLFHFNRRVCRASLRVVSDAMMQKRENLPPLHQSWWHVQCLLAAVALFPPSVVSCDVQGNASATAE